MDSDENQEESKTSLGFHISQDQLIVDTTPYEQKSSARNSATTPTAMRRDRPLSQGRKIVSLPKSRPSVGQEYVLKSRLSVGAIFGSGKQSYEASLLEKISTQKSQIENLKKGLKNEEKLVKTLMSNPDNYYIGKYAEEVKIWKNQVIEKNKEIKHMELEIIELKKNKGASKVCELKGEIEILTKICKNLEAQLSEKTSDAKNMLEDEKKIKLKIKGYENEIDALKAENKEIISKYLEKDSIISELKKKVDKLSKKKLAKRNQALKKEVERLKLKLERNGLAMASNSVQRNIMHIDIPRPSIIYRNKIVKNLMIIDIENTKINHSQIETELLITNIESATKMNPKIQTSILNIDIKPTQKSEKLNQEHGISHDSNPKNRILKIETNCNPISINLEVTEIKQNLSSDLQSISNENLIRPEDLSVQFEHFSLCMTVNRITKFEVPDILFGESFGDEMTEDELINHLKSMEIEGLLKMPKFEDFCKFLIEPTLSDFSGQNFPKKKSVSQICEKLLAHLSDWEIINDIEEEKFDQLIKLDLLDNMQEFQQMCRKFDKNNTGCVSFNQIEELIIKFLKNPSTKLMYYIKVLCFLLLHRVDAIPYNNFCLSIKNLGKKENKLEKMSSSSSIEDNMSNISGKKEETPIEQEFAAEDLERAQPMNEEGAAMIEQLQPNEFLSNEILPSKCTNESIEIKEEEVFEENKSDLSFEEKPSENYELDQEYLEEDVTQEINEELHETATIEKTQEITESETEFQHEELNHLVIQSCKHKNYEVSTNRNKKEKDEFEMISNAEIERSLTSFEESSESEEEQCGAEDEEEYNIA